MIIRLILATAGAVVITAGMLILMSEVSQMFRERSADKIFLIDDILPAPEKGRPVRPPAAALPPEREAPALEPHRTTIEVEGPTEQGPAVDVEPAPAVPRLDEAEHDRAPD